MDYKRLVSYIYNYESGIRKRNIGFSRVESKNGQCKVTIHITANLPSTEPLKVYLFHRDGSEIEGVLLGTMMIKNGMGDFRVETATNSLMDTDYGLEDISGVLIIQNQSKFFGSQWDEQEIRIENFSECANRKEKERLDKLVRDIRLEPQNVTDMIMQEALASQIKEPAPKEMVQAVELEPSEEDAANHVSDAMKNVLNEVQSLLQEEQKNKSLVSPDGQEPFVAKILANDLVSDAVETMDYKEEEVYTEAVSLEMESRLMEAESVMQERVDAVQPEQIQLQTKECSKEESVNDSVPANEMLRDKANETKATVDEEKVAASELGGTCCCSDNYPDCVRKMLKSFPPVKPFPNSESKNWVRIEPKDIGFLPVETWVLANNSFLLHGYYNYRHLLFGILQLEEGQQYVIGVPGVLQSTEQTMAGMFGFHRFMSANEGENQYGSFGYWIQQIVL